MNKEKYETHCEVRGFNTAESGTLFNHKTQEPG